MEKLYKDVYKSCVSFAVYEKKEIIADVIGFWPDLDKFTKLFFEKNDFGISDEEYNNLKAVLLDIINDIAVGVKNKDIILLEDTVEFGVLPFLEMFFSDERLIIMKGEMCGE